MSNVFNAAVATEGEPSGFTVGDFVQWKRSDLVGDYPLAAHSAEYVARIPGGGDEIRITATESDTYLFTVASVDSSAFAAGTYHWQLEITETASSNRAVIGKGEFVILADLDTDGADPRKHAQIMVNKIESLLAGKADSDVSNYSIAGRSLTKLSFQELLDARDYYRAEVRSGKVSAGSTIKVRF